MSDKVGTNQASSKYHSGWLCWYAPINPTSQGAVSSKLAHAMLQLYTELYSESLFKTEYTVDM